MNLSDRAMLVNLSIKQWSAAKHDKKVSAEVASAHNSDASMGRYNKQLLAKGALERIKKAASAARTEHYFRTLPWSDEGFRMLSSSGYFEYSAKMRALQSDFDSAVAEFVSAYPTYVDDARAKLNGLFRSEDYPTERAIREKFAFGFNISPVPSGPDFRVDLGDTETARIQAEIEASVNATVHTAMQDAWNRVREVVQHMAQRLRAYQVTPEGVSNPFRDTLVSNISDLADVLPSLNITHDPSLDAITDAIRRDLCAHSAEELRVDGLRREDTARRAEEILAKMEGFIA